MLKENIDFKEFKTYIASIVLWITASNRNETPTATTNVEQK
jgi:hypothetical protein